MNLEDIKIIRLRNTPEELVAHVTNEDAESITFEKPLLLVSRGNDMGFAVWSPLSVSRTFTFSKKTDVLFVSDVPDTLQKMYFENTSGIAIAPAGAGKSNVREIRG